MIKTIGGAILFAVLAYVAWRLFGYWRANRAGLKPYRPESPPPRGPGDHTRDK